MLREIVVNAAAWMFIQLGLVAIGNRISPQHFSVRAAGWERDGRVYEVLGVCRWKDKLPDGGSWFTSGFSKGRLSDRSKAGLERFARESRRGEIVHWCAIAALPLFAFWNSPRAMGVNAAYAVAANMPCIIAQRYNRARIARLLRGRSADLAMPR